MRCVCGRNHVGNWRYPGAPRPCAPLYRAAVRNQLRLRALAAYGGSPPVCACCHEGALPFLEVEAPGRPPTIVRYRWLARRRYPPGLGYRVLCRNCAWARQREMVCPHEDARA